MFFHGLLQAPYGRVYFVLFLYVYCMVRDNMAEWLGHRTWNPEVMGSSPALTT